MKITKEQLKQIIKEELENVLSEDETAADSQRSNPSSGLATEGRLDVEAMVAKIKSTMGWKNMQPAIARQELGLEDFELDDIASKLELSGSWDVADFVRSMLSPEAER
tara:strand:+ start:232 stop:555 length:324 start_codon:yes stop_codon:yes gene_type:complete